MWGDVSLFPWDADVPALTLCDYISGVLLGCDFQRTSSHDASRHVLAAREPEVQCLGRLGPVDAWTLAHPIEDMPNELRRKAWTWGFPARKEDQCEEAQLKRQVGLRRIDRIHVSSSIIPAVTRAYTRFTGGSDHKAVVVKLNFDLLPLRRRWKCSVQFLQVPVACDSLKRDPIALPESELWWENAEACIARVANSHYSMHRSVGITEVAAYVCSSSSDYVCPAGVELLKQRGCVLATSSEQYMALVRLMELEFDKNANSSVFDKLRVELQTTASPPFERAQRKEEIFRLMHQLQERKRLQQLRLTAGTVIRDKLHIASEFLAFWSSIMQRGAKT